jgi:hypothetical protein
MTSSATVTTGLSWTRSLTTLTINQTSHGRNNGDMVIVRNANQDNFNGPVTVINANSFSLTTTNTGGSSGSAAAYSLGFTSTSVSNTGSTVSAPSGGDVQLLSMLITDSMTGTYGLSLPASSTNGAGANTAIYDSYPPLSRVWISGSTTVTTYSQTNSATPTLFNFASVGTGDRTIRVNF